MTNEQLLDDLKQFVNGRVSQLEESIGKDLAEGLQSVRTEMAQGFSRVSAEVSNGFAGVGEAIETTHELLDEFKVYTEKRLTKLEQVTA